MLNLIRLVSIDNNKACMRAPSTGLSRYSIEVRRYRRSYIGLEVLYICSNTSNRRIEKSVREGHVT